MLISVIMSVYKSEKATLLDRALHSIWTDQILKPDQIVLIKDGPLDDKLNIVIEKWKKDIPDILDIINNTENIGLTKSLNKGLKYAKGEFIARMDSDDVSLPERFENQISYMKENPDISAVSGSVEILDEEGKYLYTRSFPLTHEKCVKRLPKGSPLSHPCVMIRRNVFDNGLKYNEKYRTSQDIALWFEMVCNGYKIGNIDKPLLKFEYDQNIFKRRSREKAKNELKIYVQGIHSLFGCFSLLYIYPIARYIFRFLPQPLIKKMYKGNIKKYYNNNWK